MREITEQDIKDFAKDHSGFQFLQHSKELCGLLNYVLENTPEQEYFTFIEIGVLYGANFTCVGNLISRFYPKVYGIGIEYPGVEEFSGRKDIDPIKEIAKLSPQFKYDIVIGKSQDESTIDAVKHLLDGRQIDHLFIDGDHSYKGCMADFTNYSPMVKNGGVIGFHDLGEYRFDVRKRVWPEIKNKYPKHLELVCCPGRFGIGLIIKE